MNDEDPIIKNHLQETASGFDADEDAMRDRLAREYPSPESAVEDYRKGYLTDAQLKLRFTDEEIGFIHKERDERDAEDSQGVSVAGL